MASFPLFLLLFLGVTVVVLTIYSYKNQPPLSQEEATVVAKRQHLQGLNAVYTEYFATFEDVNGRRKELQMSGSSYGLLIEGDRGIVAYHGKRFHEFRRFS